MTKNVDNNWYSNLLTYRKKSNRVSTNNVTEFLILVENDFNLGCYHLYVFGDFDPNKRIYTTSNKILKRYTQAVWQLF
jgi:hypothetical protein